MSKEQIEPMKTAGPNSPEKIYRDPHTGEVITKKEQEDLRKREEKDPNWFREQR